MTAKPLTPVPAPSSDEPEYEIDSFELLWEQHKTKILAGAVALVVILVAVFGWMFTTNARKSAAEAAFASAKDAAAYRAVIEKYASSPVAGDASLLLAHVLREEGKYDEANVVLSAFIQRTPEHPFAPLAKVAAAENLALAGKSEEAAKALELIAQTDANSFAAPYALWLAAELKSAQGLRESALRTYKELARAFPQSVPARVSATAAEALGAIVEPAAPSVPVAPVPPQ